MTADLRCANCNVTISKENDYTFPCGDWYCWHCHLNRNRHEGCEKCTEAAKSWFALQAKPVSPKAAEAPGGQDAAGLAQRFHETYERLAPDFGYKTREASAKPWADVPEKNKQLMVAVCREIIEAAQCKARSANMGANDPQECDWPFCGCDPKADKVIEAIQESGFTLVKDEDLLKMTAFSSSNTETWNAALSCAATEIRNNYLTGVHVLEQRVLKHCALAPAAPSERAGKLDIYCPKCKYLFHGFEVTAPRVCPNDGATLQPCVRAPSLSEERERFEEWVKKDGFPDADLSQCGCADQMRFHYQDAYTDFAYRAWQGRAGLSSQEGK